MPINSRTKYIFQDKEELGPARRSFTYDELGFISFILGSLLQPLNPRPFTLHDLLKHITSFREVPDPRKYMRPALELVHRLVRNGVLSEVLIDRHDPTDQLGRVFQCTWTPAFAEMMSANIVASVYGRGYIAHQYQQRVVRVHVTRYDGQVGIASGVVLTGNTVLTNSHVLTDAEKVEVSWGDLNPQPATVEHVHKDKGIDLAIVSTAPLAVEPTLWIRPPKVGEDVVIVGYPAVPQLESRPLLSFGGEVSTYETLTTYFGHDQMVVSAVMGPGASGAPVFGGDGQMVGMVVEHLAGVYLTDTNTEMVSIYHCAVPGDVLLTELPELGYNPQNWETDPVEEWDRRQEDGSD